MHDVYVVYTYIYIDYKMLNLKKQIFLIQEICQKYRRYLFVRLYNSYMGVILPFVFQE